MSKVQAIDLFCGVGGLSYGLKQAGIDVRLGIDIDSNCEYAYNYNTGATFLNKPIEKTEPEDIGIFDSHCIKVLAGCAPCQTFSTYNRKAGSTDDRWWLLRHFMRLINVSSPDIVTMENVPGLQRHPIYGEFILFLQKSGYSLFTEIVECSKYGIPQHRNRLVVLASKINSIRLLTPDELGIVPTTVSGAIGKLEPLRHGEFSKSDPLHRCSGLSSLNVDRIKVSKPGGTWRDWPSELVSQCHRKKSGKTYPGVYGRMKWDEPSPTITTQFFGFGNGRFGHPDQDRGLSLREGAILQSFPEDYRFVRPSDPIHMKTLGKLIGNAVPVKLGKVIGDSIIEHLSLR